MANFEITLHDHDRQNPELADRPWTARLTSYGDETPTRSDQSYGDTAREALEGLFARGLGDGDEQMKALAQEWNAGPGPLASALADALADRGDDDVASVLLDTDRSQQVWDEVVGPMLDAITSQLREMA